MALPSAIIMRDTRANQPAATAVAAGTLYYVTDETVTERSDGTSWEDCSDGGGGGGGDLGALHVQDQKSSGTDGGTFTSGAWQTRTLNTAVLNTISGASLSSSQITLGAGTYDVHAVASVYRVTNHQLKLRDVTNTADLLLGSNYFASTTASIVSHSADVQGRIVLAGTTVLELQHRCAATVSGNGFGVAQSWGTCVFADVFIRRVA